MTPALAVALGAPVAKKYSSPRKMDKGKGERVRQTEIEEVKSKRQREGLIDKTEKEKFAKKERDRW